jgi:predicted ATPase
MSGQTQPGNYDTGRLIGRNRECGELDRLIEAVRAGESRVLVMHGEPGVGKTVLLDYLARQARGLRMVRVAGMQSEMELAFAGLHQLCAPMLGHAGRIRCRSGTRCGPRWAWLTGRRRTGSWWGWRC